MKRSKKYIVDYYFNENKHWAEVYDNWVTTSDTINSISKKYKLYEIRITILYDNF